MYSLVMMVGPALFLLGLGFMMSGGFWQSILKTSRLQHVKERCNYRMKSLNRLFQPFLAPMAYITIALLHGDFLVCSSLGSLSASCYNNIQDTIISQVKQRQAPDHAFDGLALQQHPVCLLCPKIYVVNTKTRKSTDKKIFSMESSVKHRKVRIEGKVEEACWSCKQTPCFSAKLLRKLEQLILVTSVSFAIKCNKWPYSPRGEEELSQVS